MSEDKKVRQVFEYENCTRVLGLPSEYSSTRCHPYKVYLYRNCMKMLICPSRDGPYYVIGYGERAGVRPHRFPHNSSVYRIFTKLGHMIPLWKGKNSNYFGVNRSKVKVTVTINIIFDNRVVST
jgi:hypothetical protein